MPRLQKRAVTSSLILKFPNDDEHERPQLALFRRSNKVRTYQNKWGLISGSIESSDFTPLSCAWRELHEETTLSSPPLHLLRQGKPFTFEDDSVGREWTVHPFMFKLEAAREADLHLDWEHVGYKWFDPADVSDDASFEGVPRIMQSLKSVWFDIDLGPKAGRILAAGLRDLKCDFDSGARELAAKAMRIYAATVAALDASDRDAWWRNVRLAGWHLWKNGRESMGASVVNLVLAALRDVEAKLSSAASLEACTRAAIDDARKTSEQSSLPILEAFDGLLRQHFSSPSIKILTLSSSSTVTSCLIHAMSSSSNLQLDIRVLESRPLFEGVKTARTLASYTRDSKSSISVYTDASAAIAARGLHLVLLGADLIDASGNVSNKTGSLPAVLAAKHVSPEARVVVVSETTKVLPFDAPTEEERSNVEEMTRSWQQEVTFAVENVLFEWVDAALVDRFVTERGLLTVAQITEGAEKARQGADRFFLDI